ncbi:MAG: hypothetical protein ACHQLQ_02935 [Candidatus Acidiferrales bacterium]
MPKDYAVRLRCPYGDHDVWVPLESRKETLEQVMRAPWDFECPVHGVQREIPLEVSERAVLQPQFAPVPQGSPQPDAPREKKRNQRSSERKSLHVPVVVYGWTKKQGSFHEETSTLLVNDSGALLALKAKAEAGETIFLINKATREEQEIHVVYAERAEDGGMLVGAAFKSPSPGFWRKTRRNPRIPEKIRVFVKGKDHNGNPFVQSSFTIDVSKSGARLDGLGYLAGVGETIEVKRRWRGKARFRVVWIGQVGMEESNQIGICSLEEDKNIWGVKLPEEGKAAKSAPPPKKRRSS